MYAFLLNENTKQVAICEEKINDEYFEADVEQDYLGNWYLKGYAKEQPLEEAKAIKIAEFKRLRDEAEEMPAEYNGSNFDYDEHSRDRINAAIIALDLTDTSLSWTTADNSEVIVTANDLRGVIAAVAVRSNELHVKYRQLKAQCEAAQTVEELAQIVW